jgi:hypothetical protein
MPCIFCGSTGKLSREHVFPRWLRDLFPEASSGGDYIRRNVTASTDVRHERPGKSFDIVVRDVCVECNSGWMNALETEARPILTPMLRDEPTVLTTPDQHVVATWATKTMLTMQGANLTPDRYVSPERYSWFGYHRSPLSGSHVWLCRYSDRAHWPLSIHQMGMTVQPPGRPPPQIGDPMNGFGVVFAIGPLAFWLVGYDLPEGVLTQAGSDDAHVLVWPALGPDVRWPPQVTLEREDDLREMAATVPPGTQIHGRPPV